MNWMKGKLSICLLSLLFVQLSSVSFGLRASELYPSEHPKGIISYFQVDGRYDYRTALLELALSYSPDDHSATLITLQAEPDIPIPRGIHLMTKDSIQGIVSLATTKEREEKLLAIKVPIMAGILGMRVFLIHKNNKETFLNIKNLSQLKQKVAGFGEHWGDISILKENNIPVLPVVKYPSLFEMLNAQRFDYFPRGVNEILGEYEENKYELEDLAIEQSLALYYPYPVYFFVNKSNVELAKRIEYGLQQALKDGRFESLFFYYHQGLLERLNFDNRIILSITNSSLPEDAKVINRSWWYKNKESRVD